MKNSARPKPKAAVKPKAKPKPKRREPFRRVKPGELCLVRAKSYFGGKFPEVKGSKYRYPSPTNEQAWLRLIAEALTYKKRKKWCFEHGLPETKNSKGPKYDYILYHARPDPVKRRTTRNRHRREALRNGTLKPGQELHHRDAKNLRDPVAVSPCVHNRLHGEKCVKTAARPKKKS